MPPGDIHHVSLSLPASNYLSLVALVLLGTDWIGSIRSEYEHVWSKKFTVTKLMYLCSRYIPLATVIAHYCLVHFLLERGPVPASTCKGWFMFLAVSCSLLQMNLVAILVLRVWALYREDKKVVFAVCTLVVLPFVVSFVLIGRNVVAGDNFNEQCDLHHTPIEAPVLAAVYLMSHMVLWFLIFRKRNYVAPNDKRLLDNVVNTGNISFTVLVANGLMIPICYAMHSVNMILIFIFPMVSISMLSCNMVISMFRVGSAERPSKFLDTGEIVLTSVFAPSFETHELPSPISSEI
ncbi:hypothetical protein CVT26_014080 [Gymnopilus dilepis]|uniref:DUF6533 domain-containing protein n=1 Tax=Gymnopilus dilepis TaxID=231916 RepID=A0A409VX87_9AGAR|nr:hypothetical protein CVT26_014080 [Gymnopilus dilepis]